MSGIVLVNGIDLLIIIFFLQGFIGVYYQLNNDNFVSGKMVVDYEFLSFVFWVDVDVIGKVIYKNVGSNWERIMVMLKLGGFSYVYEICVKSWWVNVGDVFMIYSFVENFCSSNGYIFFCVDYLNYSCF